MCFRTRDFAQKHFKTDFQAHSQSFQASSRHSRNGVRLLHNLNAWNRPGLNTPRTNKNALVVTTGSPSVSWIKFGQIKTELSSLWGIACSAVIITQLFYQAQLREFVPNFSSRAAHVLFTLPEFSLIVIAALCFPFSRLQYFSHNFIYSEFFLWLLFTYSVVHNTQRKENRQNGVSHNRGLKPTQDSFGHVE